MAFTTMKVYIYIYIYIYIYQPRDVHRTTQLYMSHLPGVPLLNHNKLSRLGFGLYKEIQVSEMK